VSRTGATVTSVQRLGPAVALAAVALATAVSALAAPAADPRAEKVRLNAADTALAKRANLKLDDLDPAWDRTTVPPADDSTFRCPGFRPDFSAFTVTGRAESAFTRGSAGSLLSGVDVFATRSQAVGDFRAGAKPALARCLRYAAEQSFRSVPGGRNARVVSSAIVRAPRLGERRIALRLVARVSSGGRSLPIYLDLLVIQRGRSVAALMFTGLAERVEGQAGLARLVASRMR
jgi:hypothetical protein